MHLFARLLNVFAMPDAVFGDVKVSRPTTGSWLVPVLLSTLVAILSALVIASQPSVHKQKLEQIDRQAKLLDQQVKAGNIKQTDADRILRFSRGLAQPPVLRTVAGFLAGLLGAVRVFWWAFLLWLLGRALLKVRVSYLKCLEVAGLALMISVLGMLVVLLLILNVSQVFSSPSAVLLATNFDLQRSSWLMEVVLSGFSLWLIAVLSVGLAKLAGVPFIRAAWLIFTLWVIQELFVALLLGAAGQIAI
jgi:hypothetical protein